MLLTYYNRLHYEALISFSLLLHFFFIIINNLAARNEMWDTKRKLLQIITNKPDVLFILTIIYYYSHLLRMFNNIHKCVSGFLWTDYYCNLLFSLLACWFTNERKNNKNITFLLGLNNIFNDNNNNYENNLFFCYTVDNSLCKAVLKIMWENSQWQ